MQATRQLTVGVGRLHGFPSKEGVSLREYASVVAFHVQQKLVACVLCGYPFMAGERCRMWGYPSTVGGG